MDVAVPNLPEGLPPVVVQMLSTLVGAARTCFGEDLRSVVLFGSAAEGRMRATSDINLMVILRRFERQQVDAFREPLRLAKVTVQASAMFVLDSELAVAAESFAVKFGDIGRRHRTIHGEDLVAALHISREATKVRLRQVLMNLILRLRERYAALSLREEQLALAIADLASPLRSAAATLLELENQPAASPKEALAIIAAELDGVDWKQTLERISQVRESRALPPGAAIPEMFRLMELADALFRRAERLP